MSAGKVDVIAVMEALRRRENLPIAVENEAIEAVAGLIKADRAFDAAALHLRDANNAIVSGDKSDEAFVRKASCQHSYDRAVDARLAALARIGGAP